MDSSSSSSAMEIGGFDTTLIGFGLYLAVVACIGYVAYKKTKTMDDFALGGRQLGPWVIALSERASGESAWLLLGMTGAAMAVGLFEAWTALGIVLGIILSWFIIAPRLSEQTQNLNATSLPDFLAKYHRSEAIRWVSALIITFFFTFYVAAQFAGAAKVLATTFGFSEALGMLFGALIIVGYTLFGGFLAVAWTDGVQGIIMFLTLVALPIVGWTYLVSAGDAGGMWSGLSFLKKPDDVTVGLPLAIAGAMSWGLGYLGQPHLLVRYMASRSAKEIIISRRIAIAWAIPAFTGGILMGVVGHALISQGLLGSETLIASVLDDPERLMPAMAKLLLPGVVAGIFISGAIAAMMSTADSQLLVTSTVLASDVFRFFVPASSEQKILLIGRIATIGVGVVAFFLAISSEKLVYELVSYAWSGLGSSFGPAVLLTLWWQRTSPAGVFGGLAAGALFTVIDVTGGLVTVRLTSFLISFCVVVLVSIIWPKRVRQLT